MMNDNKALLQKQQINDADGTGDSVDGSSGIGSLIPQDSGKFDRQLRMTEKGITEGALDRGFADKKTHRSYEDEKKQDLRGEISASSVLEEHPLIKPVGTTPKNLEHAASENTASLDELEAKPQNELSPELRYALQQKEQLEQKKKFNPTPTVA